MLLILILSRLFQSKGKTVQIIQSVTKSYGCAVRAGSAAVWQSRFDPDLLVIREYSRLLLPIIISLNADDSLILVTINHVKCIMPR